MLENLDTTETILLLKEQQQRPGAPLIRAYCTLALSRIEKSQHYIDALEQWLERQQKHPVIQFRPIITKEDGDIHSPFKLTVQETSQLLIEAFETLAQIQTNKGIDILLSSLAHGHNKNKYIIAGLLIKSIN